MRLLRRPRFDDGDSVSQDDLHEAKIKKGVCVLRPGLRWATQPDVKTLFEELREEEAEYVRMLSDIIAKLPPSAAVDLDDLGADPYKPAKYRAPY